MSQLRPRTKTQGSHFRPSSCRSSDEFKGESQETFSPNTPRDISQSASLVGPRPRGKRENHERDRAGTMAAPREDRPMTPSERTTTICRLFLEHATIPFLWRQGEGSGLAYVDMVPVVDLRRCQNSMSKYEQKRKKGVDRSLSRAREILTTVGLHGARAQPPRGFRVCPTNLVPALCSSFCHFPPPSSIGHSQPHEVELPPPNFYAGKLEIVPLTVSTPHVQDTRSTVKMPPKKAARPAQENISLGPQIREGELVFGGKLRPAIAIPQQRHLAKIGG